MRTLATTAESVYLEWDSSKRSDLVGYMLYYDTRPDHAYFYSDSTRLIVDTSFVLAGLTEGSIYYISGVTIDTLGNRSWHSADLAVSLLETAPYLSMPRAFTIWQNHPNPFNPVTTIRFDLPEATDVSIVAYDILGREVARLLQKDLGAGYHEAAWSGRTAIGSDDPVGIYIVRLVTPKFTKSIKMVLLK